MKPTKRQLLSGGEQPPVLLINHQDQGKRPALGYSDASGAYGWAWDGKEAHGVDNLLIDTKLAVYSPRVDLITSQ
jgi:hypothetical protein